ncbi:MAG TPA: HAMP domain-containing sensor histidine kinase [Aggregatilineales bacterium]|nr:HAMP domain-containing sensor histidine kinase [Aggregatilineales bacterium]
MTDQVTSPLQQAQQLVTDLQQRIEQMRLSELKAALAQLNDLLAQSPADPARSPQVPAPLDPVPEPGGDVEGLRMELDALTNRAASFNSMMVHEIRKPMTSIRGYADMLAKPGLIGPLNEMQQNFIDTIRTNIIRMEGLVSDISDLSKLSYNRIRLDSKMTTFGQVVMEVQKVIEPFAKDYEPTSVTFDVPQGMPVLTVDSIQLAKVIINLIKNALQYTPKGGAVTVKAERRDNNVHVAVSDTGIGMKPEDIARLGEPFFRGDNELVLASRGYGMGVPVAMGFLRLMNSSLQVESTPGAGSTFSFDIAGMG